MKQFIYMLSVLLLFVLAIYFALAIEWEYDEAWSFMVIHNNTFGELLMYTKFQKANNHLWNSLWFKLCQQLSFNTILAYRALSLISFLVFSYLGYRIIKLISNGKNNYLHWLALAFNISFYYFSIGRGYGVALCFFVYNLFFCLNTLANKENIKFYSIFLLSCFFSSTGILSNFYINSTFIIAFWIAYSVKFYTFNFKQLWLNHKGHILLSALYFALLTPYIYHIGNIINTKDPSIIGSSSLIKNGLFSSILSYMALQDFVQPDRLNILKLAFIASLLLVLTVLFIKGRKELFRNDPVLLFCIIAFSGTIVLFIISHVILHAKYPMGRALLPINYLLVFTIVYLVIRFRISLLAFLPFYICIVGAGIGIVIKLFHQSTFPRIEDELCYLNKHVVQIPPQHKNPNLDLALTYTKTSCAINQPQKDTIYVYSSWSLTLEERNYLKGYPNKETQSNILSMQKIASIQ
jgi:hypothetical protein